MNKAKPIKLWVVDTIHIKHVVVRLGNYDGTNMRVKIMQYRPKQHFSV